jgi:hypothetical protein
MHCMDWEVAAAVEDFCERVRSLGGFFLGVYIFALFPMCQSTAISHNELHRTGFSDSNLNGA